MGERLFSQSLIFRRYMSKIKEIILDEDDLVKIRKHRVRTFGKYRIRVKKPDELQINGIKVFGELEQ
jgi:hypothetical protein